MTSERTQDQERHAHVDDLARIDAECARLDVSRSEFMMTAVWRAMLLMPRGRGGRVL